MRNVKTDRNNKRETATGRRSTNKITVSSISVCHTNLYSNKASFKFACIVAHGGGFPMINNIMDNKVRGWGQGRRERYRERERKRGGERKK